MSTGRESERKKMRRKKIRRRKGKTGRKWEKK